MVSGAQPKPQTSGEKKPMARAINVPPPQPLDVSDDGKLAERWRSWKQQYEDYIILTQAQSEPEEFQTALFRHIIGPDATKILNSLVQSQDKTLGWRDLLTKMETYCVGQTNEIYERYRFNNRLQGKHESFNDFLTNLKSLAASCNFCKCMHDSLIRDRITTGLANPATTKRLLQVQNLTLQQCIDICRGEEAAEKQMSKITAESQFEINRIQQKVEYRCSYCNQKHKKGRNACPAWGKECSKCGKKNHFASCCLTKIASTVAEPEEQIVEISINNVQV